MLSKKIVSLISEQIKNEYESAYLYLEVADYFHSEGLNGFANWYLIQAREEVSHAEIFYDYLHRNNERAQFFTLEPSRKVFMNHKMPIEDSLRHEEFITDCINKIYEHAEKEKDYRTKKLLNWFISEQQEEEDAALENLERIQLFGGNPAGLFLLDKEMAKRCFKIQEKKIC